MKMNSSLKRVELQADVYMTCLQHALSTENYEVMGLLIGTMIEDVAQISAVIILRRLDKKKDRVEISPEQLMKATAEAERFASESGLPIRVIGWYHSHPHITVCPSHVDVGTQATYQMMDSGFVGLIFSVFSEVKDTKEQEVFLACFQSQNNEAVEIPLQIVYTSEISDRCLKTMIQLPRILDQEEENAADSCVNNTDPLATIYNDAVKTRQFAHITDIITRPLILSLESRIEMNRIRVNQLRKELAVLQNIQIH
ncbi:lys-63-specific deubiquitinase BRCC36-like [Diachasmimorpha longicaudata]|uniref:lys-63-specific deubiquitinase BRCC36-like n=1 Tax=Diachasmimorpha longicaudata TaxID=58733 RepID=UPI0030B8AF3E